MLASAREAHSVKLELEMIRQQLFITPHTTYYN